MRGEVISKKMTSKQQKITDDLDAMLSILPPDIAQSVQAEDNFDNLLEIILDLGRKPAARFIDSEVVLLPRDVTQYDLDYVTERIGSFDADNRAGLERTLHRISAIRNRRGEIVGLTCRVGRAVYGTIEIIADLINSGESILLLGKPGVGKTTMLREAARILAETKRVIIVDTSNEIGGDGDVPHPAVGRARRMQVPKPSLQHEVMIEAVENHNPEVIVIDEIGRELEAQAARTIAERGVQLIGTAHGNALENLLLNPTLSDLVGGIESVTLSDDEARRRGTQKTVLERRAPPTFTVLVEIQSRQHLCVYTDVAAAVDALLRGYPTPPEERYWDEEGKIRIQRVEVRQAPTVNQSLRRGNGMEKTPFQRGMSGNTSTRKATLAGSSEADFETHVPAHAQEVKNIYAFGVARNRLLQVIKNMGVPARLVRNLEEADTFVTQRRYYRERLQPVIQAEEMSIPVFVIKSNSVNQIEQFLANVFMVPAPHNMMSEHSEALEQAEDAIQMVLAGEKYVDLRPASANVRREQHQLAQKASLVSQSFGTEPNRFVRIFRD
jgi:stage III sporulation protein SpoIIIAA